MKGQTPRYRERKKEGKKGGSLFMNASCLCEMPFVLDPRFFFFLFFFLLFTDIYNDTKADGHIYSMNLINVNITFKESLNLNQVFL